MSKKKQTAESDKPPGKSSSPFNSYPDDRPSDFWWNAVYFLILNIAIVFILANNTWVALKSPTGIITLLLLGFLDIFPVLYFVKLLIRIVKKKRKRFI